MAAPRWEIPNILLDQLVLNWRIWKEPQLKLMLQKSNQTKTSTIKTEKNETNNKNQTKTHTF